MLCDEHKALAIVDEVCPICAALRMACVVCLDVRVLAAAIGTLADEVEDDDPDDAMNKLIDVIQAGTHVEGKEANDWDDYLSQLKR